MRRVRMVLPSLMPGVKIVIVNLTRRVPRVRNLTRRAPRGRNLMHRVPRGPSLMPSAKMGIVNLTRRVPKVPNLMLRVETQPNPTRHAAMRQNPMPNPMRPAPQLRATPSRVGKRLKVMPSHALPGSNRMVGLIVNPPAPQGSNRMRPKAKPLAKPPHAPNQRRQRSMPRTHPSGSSRRVNQSVKFMNQNSHKAAFGWSYAFIRGARSANNAADPA